MKTSEPWTRLKPAPPLIARFIEVMNRRFYAVAPEVEDYSDTIDAIVEAAREIFSDDRIRICLYAKCGQIFYAGRKDAFCCCNKHADSVRSQWSRDNRKESSPLATREHLYRP